MKYCFHTDHHIAIGRTHVSDGKPCQDHALSGVTEDTHIAYAVISDGCSSAGETDIGARLLTTLSAKKFRNYFRVGTKLYVEGDAFDIANSLGLKPADLLATHMWAVVDNEGFGQVVVKGDGVVVFVWGDGGISIYKHEWANEMPFYPLYINLAPFENAHGGIDADALTISHWYISPEGECEKKEDRVHSVKMGSSGMSLFITPDSAEVSLICLFSDGVNKVDKIDWLDAVKQLIAFKDRKGYFAKRRMIRFIQESLKIGRGPIDDLSCAVITFKSDVENDAI